VGTDPAGALKKQQREKRLLTARDSAQEAETEIVEPNVRRALSGLSGEICAIGSERNWNRKGSRQFLQVPKM
jgi:hypothetical protein